MRVFWFIIYLLFWSAYLISSVTLYPYWSSQVLIPVFPLLALGTWLFGKKPGLLCIAALVIHHYLISSFLHGDTYVYYEDRVSGAFIGITIVLLVSGLRSSHEALKSANIRLDQSVRERNAELGNLTVQLLNEAEETRIRHGQTLHDGIGQQLTGIQLYCTSLAEQLEAERNPQSQLAFSIISKTKTAHDIIRRTARMLFPVRMHETGLIPAINELVSCFNEMKHMSVQLEVNGDFRDIPDGFALGLYRICHESVMCAATTLNASTIQLGIKENPHDYEISMRNNGTSWSPLNGNMEQKVILYRLQSLQGKFSSNQPVNGFENLIYRIPKV